MLTQEIERLNQLTNEKNALFPISKGINSICTRKSITTSPMSKRSKSQKAIWENTKNKSMPSRKSSTTGRERPNRPMPSPKESKDSCSSTCKKKTGLSNMLKTKNNVSIRLWEAPYRITKQKHARLNTWRLPANNSTYIFPLYHTESYHGPRRGHPGLRTHIQDHITGSVKGTSIHQWVCLQDHYFECRSWETVKAKAVLVALSRRSSWTSRELLETAV